MRTGPLPLRAIPKVIFLLETALMKLHDSFLSLEFAGIDMAHDSTTAFISFPPGSVADPGNGTAFILPAKGDCSALLSCALRAKGRTQNAARPCCIQVTMSSLRVVA